MAADSVQQHMHKWLRSGLTGCRFASAAAAGQEPPLRLLVILGPADRCEVEDVDRFLDLCASKHVPGMIVFPSLGSESDLDQLIGHLAHHDRWECRDVSIAGASANVRGVRIEWRTRANHRSRTMDLHRC